MNTTQSSISVAEQRKRNREYQRAYRRTPNGKRASMRASLNYLARKLAEVE